MKGTRTGDFSRILFDRKRHYTAVHMQQGRVQLDSDWNAQADLAQYRSRIRAVDLIGRTGGPADELGFGLRAASGLVVGPDNHFVMIGGREGCSFPESEDPEAGSSLEILLTTARPGTIFSRWQQSAAQGFELVYELRFEAVDPTSSDQMVLCFHRHGLPEPDLRSAPLAIARGQVLHVAVSYQGHETSIYLGGSLVARDPNGFRLAAKSTIFLLGASFQGNKPDRHLDGHLLGFRFWGRALAAEELSSWHRAADRDPSPHLIGDWRFDEARGSAVLDMGPGGNHGKILGAPTPPRWQPLSLVISAGRYYVDGILCEQETPMPYERQSDFPGAELPPSPSEGGAAEYLFYLDVWEREITAIQDPTIREVALGGPDTTTRSKVISQVRWVELPGDELSGGNEAGPPAKPLLGSELDLEGLLEKPGHPAPEWGRLAAMRQGTSMVSNPGNHLYRVEIHGDSIPAAFKWSRDNGATCFPIAPIPVASSDGNSSDGSPPQTTSVTLLPYCTDPLDLVVGSWVEIIDDSWALRQDFAHLSRVTKIDNQNRLVFLSPAPPPGVGHKSELHPFLRVWNQGATDSAPVDSQEGVVPATGDWQTLELGIQVKLDPLGSYRPGDYWLFPARQNKHREPSPGDSNQWSRDPLGDPLWLPPDGVRHHYAALARLVYENSGFFIEDLRRPFQPFSTGGVSKAGDYMTGPLDVRADTQVRGDLRVQGNAFFECIYGTLCGADMVDTEQIVDRAISSEKISPDVGTVPTDAVILATGEKPLQGYEATGSEITLFRRDLKWLDLLEIPSALPGPLVSTAVGEKVYTFLESGDVWVYEASSNSWRPGRNTMPAPRRHFAVATLQEKIYAVGGLDATGRPTATNFEFDPATESWASRRQMATPRSHFALAARDGWLHAVGGLRPSWLGQRVTARHEAYDPDTDTWHPRKPLPRGVCGLAASALGPTFSVAGGEVRLVFGRWGRALTDRHLMFHPSSNSWQVKASLPTPRRDQRLAQVFGQLVAVGGRAAFGALADCDRYDPAVDGWLPQTPMHEAIAEPGVAAVAGNLYVIGAMRSPSSGVLVECSAIADRYALFRREPACSPAQLGSESSKTPGTDIAEREIFEEFPLDP